jgi:polar amino acid transport system substrate-binding protein
MVATVIWLFEMKKNPEFPRNPIHGIGKGIWWASVTMTGVGYGDTVPRTLNARIIGIIWMFFGVLMVSIITATVTSTLTSQRLTSDLKTTADLYRVNVGAVEKENPMTLLQQQGYQTVGFQNLNEAVSSLSLGKIDAVVHDQPIIQYHIRKNPSLVDSITLADFHLRKEEYGIAVSKPAIQGQRNYLIDQINKALVTLKTTGTYDEIVELYLGS